MYRGWVASVPGGWCDTVPINTPNKRGLSSFDNW